MKILLNIKDITRILQKQGMISKDYEVIGITRASGAIPTIKIELETKKKRFEVK